MPGASRGGGWQPGGPAGSAGPAPPGVLETQAPWYDVKQPGATDLRLEGIAAIDGAVTTAWVTIAELAIPDGAPAVLRSVAFILVGAITAATRAQMRITQDGAPIPGWSEVAAIAIPATSTALTFDPDEVYLVLRAGATLRLEGRVQDGAAYTFQLATRGWNK